MLQQLALLKGFDLDGARSRPVPTSSTCWSNAPSSPMPTARNSTAIPISSRCRWRRCCRTPTTTSAASWSRDKASLELRPGSVEGFGAVVKLRRAEGQRARRRRHGRGRADRRPHRRGARRHRAFRHHRPGRQHGLGDAVRRLAAILAGDPRARLLPRHAARRCSGSRKAIRPRSRPASGRAPRCRRRMALRDGEPYLAWGSPGGDQQDQWTTQFFLRHVHAGMNLQEAIDAPAWHSEHFPISFWPRTARPGVLVVEGRLPKATVDGARAPRPHGRGRRRLVGRPPDRRLARRPPPPRRRQSARHAGYARGGEWTGALSRASHGLPTGKGYP